MLVLFCGYWSEWRFEKVTVSGRYLKFIDDYKDYFFKTKDGARRGWTDWYVYKKIYFLPGQKELFLNKIKNEISVELEIMVKENNDIFYKYEIHDDFKQVYLYENKDYMDEKKRNSIRDNIIIDRIIPKIKLYNDIKNGHIGSFNEDAIEFIKDE